MISQLNLQRTKTDVLKTFVIIVSSHVIVQTLGSKKYFSDDWIALSGSTLIGFIVFGLFSNKIIELFNLQESSKSGMALKDFIRYFTMLLVRYILMSIYNQKNILDSNRIIKWLTPTLLSCVGLILYNLFLKPIVPAFFEQRKALNDSLKFSVVSTFTDFVPDFELDSDLLKKLVTKLIGTMSYHTIMPNGGE